MSRFSTNVPGAAPSQQLRTPVGSASYDGRSWTLELPFTTAPSLNHRKHWAPSAAEKKAWRDAACLLARAAKVPAMARIGVELHWVPPDLRRRDPDNLVAAMKPAVDGLVDAAIVHDDTAEYVVRQFPVIHEKGPARPNGNRFWLVIWPAIPATTGD